MSESINVLMLVLNLDIGGQEQMIKELCIELEPLGIKPSVCCLDELGDLAQEVQAAGVSVKALNKGAGFSLQTVLGIRKYIQEHNIHILHSHNAPGLVYGALATLISNVTHVHTRHGVGQPGSRVQLRNKLCGLTLKKLVAVSDSLMETSIEFDGIDKSKVSVIANGVNLRPYLELELPSAQSERPVIGHVARLSEVKNQKLLLELFSKFLKTKPKAQLIVVGDGPNRQQLLDYAKQLKIQDQVEFTGARRDIPSLLNRFHWVALTSTSEGTPMSAIEAMAAGRPITTTNVGGMAEIVEHGKTGYLTNISSADEMLGHWEHLADDKDLGRRLGLNARESVQRKYGADRMAQEYASLYRAALGSTK